MAFGHAIARLRDFVHRVQPVNLGLWPRDRSIAGLRPSRSTC
ncbi:MULTISPECIES: hypothetical protein [unclassified Moorena]|nr:MULTISPECIES: hypothetical protein [unclassified Moorena]